MASPARGPAGNVEFLLWARAIDDGGALDGDAVAAAVDEGAAIGGSS
jgi:hypothetical protein